MIVLSTAYQNSLAFWPDSGTVTTSETQTYKGLVKHRPVYSLDKGELPQVERRREFPVLIPKEWT